MHIYTILDLLIRLMLISKYQYVLVNYSYYREQTIFIITIDLNIHKSGDYTTALTPLYIVPEYELGLYFVQSINSHKRYKCEMCEKIQHDIKCCYCTIILETNR